ncbi:pirin family protein [Thiomicrorhabdus sp. ZW0627]|uniref:pirin family protein n=1 Tax=Thiomicrorhabdus sp. ZW0627 TaxID=3039774 RepID=UPI0024363E82|nr:pirin family protein [Thiomicrorhabdus sp. ZW0627]MDG6774004.1 pirin family protein [Thiomicrorhabdus sp. ZW0627]
MSREYHPADDRGVYHHGWLHSYHSFSFGSYYDPERMGFGLLRVINDDRVAPSMGFETHPHNNMEIISIPLKGRLRHEDSMGNRHTIQAGEIQVMSAGTGVSHSEYNDSDSEEVNFLQIWVMPKQLNIEPRYGQKAFDAHGRKNRFQLIVSPDEQDDSIWINQDAYFSLADIDEHQTLFYKKYQPKNGVFIFLLEGNVQIDLDELKPRDALAIPEDDNLEVRAHENSKILCIEVPLA